MLFRKDGFMKNKLAFIMVVFLVLAMALSVVGCKETLNAPTNLEMSGSELSWQAVEGAELYRVDVEGIGVFETKNTYYTIEVPTTGTYNIKVCAVKGELVSEYSAVYQYVVSQMLSAPVATYDEIAKVVSWGAVDGAQKYIVRVRYSDKDISAEGAIIEQTEVTATEYTLTKEEYGKTGGFIIEVKAIAEANSAYSDSAYSKAVEFVNSAELAIPTITSITSSRIYWNSVANAKSYLLIATNKQTSEQYTQTVNATTSTSVSAQFSNFNIDKIGEYYIQIKTVGDGVIYQDSELSSQSDSYMVYKLGQMSEDSVKLVEDAEGTKLIWTLTDEQHQFIETFSIVLTPKNSDGEALLSSQRETINLTSESDKSKYTVVHENGVYTYTYAVDKKFFTVDSENNEINYLLAESYYGKRYDVSVLASRSGNGVIAGKEINANEKYLSYKKPVMVDGNYQISKASELAYIAKEPNANYVQTADINFENYEWIAIPQFNGSYNGGNYIISNISIIEGESDYLAFFAEVGKDAKVVDLKLVNVTISTQSNKLIGTIAGLNNGQISNCVAYGSIEAEYSTVGGLVGQNNGTVASSVSVVDIKAGYAGGFVAINSKDAYINFSQSRGNVSVTVYEEKESTPYYTSGFAYAGGFVAVNDGTIIGSNAVGNVSTSSKTELNAPNYAGGFVAVNNGTISLSYAGANYSEDYSKRNSVTAEGKNQGISAGGFVGYNAQGATIDNSYANVKATSSKYTGGFVGLNEGAISNAYSIGGAVSGTQLASGFVGSNSGTVNNAYFYDESMTADSNRSDKSEANISFVAKQDIGSVLAEKLGENFASVSSVKNAVLKNMIYTQQNTIEISPSQAFTLNAQYADSEGTKEINAINEVSGDGYRVSGSTATEGTALLILSNGSYRYVVIVTIK